MSRVSTQGAELAVGERRGSRTAPGRAKGLEEYGAGPLLSDNAPPFETTSVRQRQTVFSFLEITLAASAFVFVFLLFPP